MWKYRCKNQLIVLVTAFVVGTVVAFLICQEPGSMSVLLSNVPENMVSFIAGNPWLVYLSGGLFFAGLSNVFLLGILILNEWSISPFILFLIITIFPTIILYIGILLVPFTLILSLYGWLSLRAKTSRFLLGHNLKNEDEIIRIYLIHHPLDPKYEALGVQARRVDRQVRLIYILGAFAVLSVYLFLGNIWISLLLILLCFLVIQFLARYRAAAFLPISALLFQNCDPEACMSALIYYCRRGNHYRLAHQALMAQCLIYMNDPSLAQDILSTYSRPTPQTEMTYWSLMSSCYYLLADESGLHRCLEAVSGIRMGFGKMALLIRGEEQSAIQNRINLMNGDFTLCKQYYLNQLKKASMPLVRVNCQYYIALISFVEKDFSLAEIYFEKVIQGGSKLYFAANARHYLDIIQNLPDYNQDAPQQEE